MIVHILFLRRRGCWKMIRFKVVKGSHLLLAAAIILLLAVIAYIGVQIASTGLPSDGAEVVQTTAAMKNGAQIRVIPDPTTPPPSSPRVLIYHTHTHEAYAQTEDDPYEAIEAWRTEDEKHSVVRVGEALSALLREKGYDVTHDVTDHEQDDLGTAYVRSNETLNGYAEPFDLYIDLHRDAYSEGLAHSLKNGDTEYAQIMLLVGRGDAYAGNEAPDYEGNLAFAQQLTQNINRRIDGLCRNVTVKKGRYNQQIGTPALLIEVGHNLNTLQQALNSTPALADALDATYRENR